MKNTLSTLKFIAQSIIVGLAIGFLIFYFKPQFAKNTITNTPNNNQSAPFSYASAVNKISPSVVSIYAQTEMVKTFRVAPELGKFMGSSTLIKRPVTQQYLGSGVIMSDDGYIVTNDHVIKGATQIIVSLWDNTLLEAKLIGSDKVTDLAVLKVEAINLITATFADSDNTQTGDIVMAVGNPYGLSQSVSLGIVSAKGRSGLSVSTVENFIQTDAAINNGNSGGALINAEGDVVGISTATFNQEGAQGINFAIPSNATRLITQKLLENGKIFRGWLGIYLYTPQFYYRQRTPEPESGVTVYLVYRDFPANLAGIKHNDVITHINDIAIVDQYHYKEIIAQSSPGEVLEIVGISDGKPFNKKVATVERPPLLKFLDE
jgi:serine protease DegS/serine protease DegQ